MSVPCFTNSTGMACNLNVNSESPNGFQVLKRIGSRISTSKFLLRNESNYALRESVNKLVVPSLLLFSRRAAQNFVPAYLVTLESRHSKKGFNFRLFIYICIWRALPTRMSHTSRQLVKLHTLHVYTVEDYNGKVIRKSEYSWLARDVIIL